MNMMKGRCEKSMVVVTIIILLNVQIYKIRSCKWPTKATVMASTELDVVVVLRVPPAKLSTVDAMVQVI